jgi:hypothetical protein
VQTPDVASRSVKEKLVPKQERLIERVERFRRGAQYKSQPKLGL